MLLTKGTSPTSKRRVEAQVKWWWLWCVGYEDKRASLVVDPVLSPHDWSEVVSFQSPTPFYDISWLAQADDAAARPTLETVSPCMHVSLHDSPHNRERSFVPRGRRRATSAYSAYPAHECLHEPTLASLRRTCSRADTLVSSCAVARELQLSESGGPFRPSSLSPSSTPPQIFTEHALPTVHEVGVPRAGDQPHLSSWPQSPSPRRHATLDLPPLQLWVGCFPAPLRALHSGTLPLPSSKGTASLPGSGSTTRSAAEFSFLIQRQRSPRRPRTAPYCASPLGSLTLPGSGLSSATGPGDPGARAGSAGRQPLADRRHSVLSREARRVMMSAAPTAARMAKSHMSARSTTSASMAIVP